VTNALSGARKLAATATLTVAAWTPEVPKANAMTETPNNRLPMEMRNMISPENIRNLQACRGMPR
jgi:hypothetical protein